jgi:LAS superfamily LD-carboxypeptidase LdcB
MNKSTHGQTQDHLRSLESLFIHKDVVDDFENLKKSASSVGIDLTIVSGFRSFQRQKEIWNKKVPKNYLKEDIETCLRWSAMPGFSRHHWGTDLDIIDNNPLTINQDYIIQLIPSEYEENGIFSNLGKWLDENIDDSFFFRPYSKDLGGVAQEPWHISHRIQSSLYMNTLSLESSLEFIKSDSCHDIHGLDYLITHFEYIYNNYITNIT